MISIDAPGSFTKTDEFLKQLQEYNPRSIFERYGNMGVAALSRNTPSESGLTASSWTYDIVSSGTALTITWHNTNVVGGTPIAILLQYGHGTRTGGYVQGRDYINPAIQPIFDMIADEMWKEVTRK